MSQLTAHPTLDTLIAGVRQDVVAAYPAAAHPTPAPFGPHAPLDPATLSAIDVAAMIDHTLLKPQATEEQIRQLCEEARTYGFASVCINPTWVPLCAQLLAGSSTKVCTVAGFPLGATLTSVKAYETERAIAAGAQEVDMVLNVGALKSGLLAAVGKDIAAVVEVGRQAQAVIKVIIETCYLTETEKIAASILTQAAGADYVKTSTGFGPAGATTADVALMRQVVGPAMGLKAAGGIRTAADARAMIAAGATRIGASAGVQIIGAWKEGKA
jgi:deoxyribose-phosphate aldolase